MIRCIAVDDEPLALDQIARFIRRIPSLELVATCYSTEQAAVLLNSDNIDLLFLDIEMPDSNGVDFAHSLVKGAPYIIFTTAYPQYAVDGFRLDAVDYLMKPLSFDELTEAVEKVKRRMASAPEQRSAGNGDIYIKADGTVRRINKRDITFVKGLSEYVQIAVRGERSLITTHDSLKHFEELLDDECFMRIHKSYIVNLAHIDEADRTQVKAGGTIIPVGEKYRASFQLFLKKLL